MDVNKDAALLLAGRLLELIRRHAKPEAARWLETALGELTGPNGRAQLHLSFASAGRKVGSAALPALAAATLGPAIAPQIAGRGLDEVARVALALTAPDAVPALYLQGDQREKQAVLRALPLFPDPAQFLELAVESVRSSVQTIFEAIACENSFPAEHFSDAQLNQLVLKALFNEVPIARILGLGRRIQPELIRMVQGYAAERRAAGRPVPADIDVIIATGSQRSA
jgi:hypothetical protein